MDESEPIVVDDESRPSVKLDMMQVIFFQILATSRLFNAGDPQALTSVDDLEAVAIGYLEKKGVDYAARLQVAKDARDEAWKSAEDLDSFKANEVKRKADFAYAMVKKREICRILYSHLLGNEEVVEV